MSRQDCNICCKTLAESKFISCLYCNESACRYCHQTYIKDQTDDNCMFCKKRWNLEFMYENFTSSFMKKEYKEIKSEILFEREKALLPETQKEMEIREKIKQNSMKIMEYQADNGCLKHTELPRLNSLYTRSLINSDHWREQTKKLEKKYRDNIEKIEELRAINSVLDASWKDKDTEEKKEPVYPCSVNDCRGFLSLQGHELICGICKTSHCKDCRTKADDEHKCSKETLETIKMLDKETKPCPKCHIPIYKTSGCDQMWCTKCHTAFSWNTGMVESGHIHNPHYWQYMQSQGRDLEEVRRMNQQRREENRCIELIDIAVATQAKNFSTLCTILSHLRHAEYVYHEVTDHITRNRDLRQEYLKNKLNVDKFKKEIYKREKRNWFNIDLRQNISMLYDTSKDLIVNVYNMYYHTREYRGQLKDVLAEIHNIVEYSNVHMKKICERYGYVFTNINYYYKQLSELTDVNTPL